MTAPDIRPVGEEDAGLIHRLAERHWGSADIISRGRRHHLPSCPGLVARAGGEVAGFVSWTPGRDGLEIVALMAVVPGRGIGSALLGAAVDAAREGGAGRVWLITTNDNTPALRFYQKRDFRVVALHRGAVEEARAIKPELPETGVDDIPVRDEIELEIKLAEGREGAVKEYRFMQVDVFTDRPFGGNPLAVFPDACGLSGEEMQAVAREMNLSETTFVLPASTPGAAFKLRIFTPARELPFAGHPVIGTHWVLARLGKVELTGPVTTVRLEMEAGVLPADLHAGGRGVERVIMTQGRPRLLAVLDDVGDLARGLGLDAAAITATGLPVQVVSTGVPQMMIPVRSLKDVQALDAASLNVPALARACGAVGTECTAVFTVETESPGSTVHVRMFAPLLGVPEDPATGSACGGLGAYLVHHRVIPCGEPTVHIRCEQGIEIGRPSVIDVEVDHSGGSPVAVRVGGQVVEVGEGVLRF